MIGLSYWVKVLDFQDNVAWEGMVYAHEENDQLQIHAQEQDNIPFLEYMKHHSNKKVVWERVWEDVTNKYRLQSGSIADDQV
jgi:hypothetical protein